MSIAKIIWLVSLLAAIVFAFVSGFEFEGTILAVLGLLSGWFLDHDHRRGAIIAAIFLMAGGASALNGIVGIGGYLTDILTALGVVFGGASVMAIVRTLLERILGKTASAE